SALHAALRWSSFGTISHAATAKPPPCSWRSTQSSKSSPSASSAGSTCNGYRTCSDCPQQVVSSPSGPSLPACSSSSASHYSQASSLALLERKPRVVHGTRTGSCHASDHGHSTDYCSPSSSSSSFKAMRSPQTP